MSILNTGAPHFKSVIKQHRHANYTLAKVLNEFIDNVNFCLKKRQYRENKFRFLCETLPFNVCQKMFLIESD